MQEKSDQKSNKELEKDLMSFANSLIKMAAFKKAIFDWKSNRKMSTNVLIWCGIGSLVGVFFTIINGGNVTEVFIRGVLITIGAAICSPIAFMILSSVIYFYFYFKTKIFSKRISKLGLEISEAKCEICDDEDSN